MTAYLECTDCGGSVPWYYAFEFKLVPHGTPLHPYCARDRVDEEGCGAVWLAIAIELSDEVDQKYKPPTHAAKGGGA